MRIEWVSRVCAACARHAVERAAWERERDRLQQELDDGRRQYDAIVHLLAVRPANARTLFEEDPYRERPDLPDQWLTPEPGDVVNVEALEHELGTDTESSTA